MNDWKGNNKSVFSTLGASNHSDTDREEHDYYATDPCAVDILLSGGGTIDNPVWECACGEGHLSKRLVELGYNVRSTDLIYRGYGTGGIDFFKQSDPWAGDILTNPPYRFAKEFTEHALSLIPDGNRVYMFLRLQFLEGRSRRSLFDTGQLKTVYVFSGRVKCAKNGHFDGIQSAVAYCWYEFIKGYYGPSIIKWVN